uniref:Nipped-B protein n=2 Tax=Parascaris univalens TaxID=6257 RepID=A0A915BWJ3_PARUN
VILIRSEGRRRRQRTKTFEEEQHEKKQLELIAQMEMAEASEKKVDETHKGGSEVEHRPGHAGTSGEEVVDEDEKPKFFASHKRGRKRQREAVAEPPDRPPTPTEIIQQRESEWRERQRKRQEKHKRRQNDSESDCWNNEVMAEKESYAKFTSIIDQIFDNVEDMDIVGGAEDEETEIPQELLIDKHQLEELRKEAQKLKSWKRINKVHPDRLVKLLTILEKNIRDVIAVEGSQPLIPFFDDADDDESDEAYRELVDDRILRAADASCTAMMIMTSTKMPKQVYIEDTIDRSIQLCKQFLQHIIYPASDALCRSTSKARKTEDKKRRKTQSHARSQTLQKVYTRITELVGCFAELVRTQQLTETAVLHLCTVGCGPFFVDNTGELQLQAIKLLCAICARYEHFRNTIIQDLLNSLHRLPSTKNARNSYRMSADDWVSNLTVLVMQLVQSAVKVPRRRRSEEGQQSDPNEEAANADAVVKESFRQSQNMAKMFLSSFLGKCTAKSEEDYRRLFDQFLHDLLAALYKPEWPAAEMMLSTLGTLLIASYRSKSIDMSLRVACLDYLGTITARHRRDLHHTVSDDVRLDMVVKVLVYDELDESEQTGDVNAIDISHLSGADKMRKVQRALIDYLVEKKGDADVSIEYAVMFYVGEWYKEVYEEGESAKQKLKQALNSSELSDKEKRKFEKKTERVLERCQLMKDFFMKTADKKQMRKRAEHIARTGNILMDSDAMWLVKYLASNREFSQSFDMYLKQILMGIHIEGAVGLRTKAMRCLTLIIESDPEVLRIPEVQKAVQVKMMDQNAAVREATIELVGKYVIAKPDVLPQYYEILIERVKDSGVAVRKRVIRIMREMCEKQPNFEKIPEMLSRIVRRISDEEGVKKLTVETFQTLWFQPTRERDSVTLVRKVMSMTEMVQICVKENSVEFFEQLLHCLLRGGDRTLLCASRQMIDTLVDNVLTLDSKIASDESKVNGSTEESTSLNAAAAHASHQERLLACLTTLSLFSKVRPDLMVKHAETLQPYLSMSITSPSEQQVMNQVINMLERVVPLMEHPSESFLKCLDDGLCILVKDSGMRIISSALACISAIYNKWKKRRPAVIETFLSYLRFLNQMRDDVENKPGHSIPPEKGPVAQRSLYSIGLMCRHFDVDAILEGDVEARKNLSAYCSLRQSNAESTANHVRISGDEEDSDHTAISKKPQPYKEDVFQVLSFFSRNRDGAIRMKALNALGNFTATHADFLLRREMRNMYVTLLNVDDQEYLNLKIQTLKNLELFLMAEESKMVKNNDEWNKAKEGQDLKEMELANSGLASTIIQIYWAAILNSYYNRVDAVRMAAVQVTVLTLGQGLVTPGSSIPTLIAMSTDSIAAIRNKVGNLLKDIDSKYAGMVPSKAISGIRCSFRLQRHLKREQGTPVRGIRACDPSVASGAKGVLRMEHGVPKMTNDGQAILSGLYQSLRINRQQRRSFLTSVLRLFSEDCREKLSLEEWVFVADNIAMFPYQVLDEPLYVIRHIESTVSVSGQNIISSFKMQLMPRPGNAEPLDDDSEFDPELIYRRLPEDKSLLHECMKNSQACFLLLYLKNFLMKLYSFSEAKVQEYSPSEAAKVYEKALSTRKNIAMFYPQTALQELRPEAAHQRDTVNGHINMANQIVYFRNMLLSLDRADDDEDVVEENPTVNHHGEDSEEEETAVDEDRSGGRMEVTSSANEQPDH